MKRLYYPRKENKRGCELSSSSLSFNATEKALSTSISYGSSNPLKSGIAILEEFKLSNSKRLKNSFIQFIDFCLLSGRL